MSHAEPEAAEPLAAQSPESSIVSATICWGGIALRELDANVVRRIRQHRGLTLEMVAALSGLRTTTIQAIERQNLQTRMSTVRLLAAALDVDPETLLVKRADDEKFRRGLQ
jgi:DNA-binding XRE family transcriptional regulator